MIAYKDISELTHKTVLTGSEKIPVSGQEYVTTEDIAQIPSAPATPTADGLMSAADKVKLDGLSGSSAGVKPLARAVLASSGVIDGGKAYSSASACTVTGVGTFSDTAEMSTIVVPGNITVSFASQFRLQKDLSTVSGTSLQFKLYTIQRSPMPGGSARGDVCLVNCALYG